MEIERKFLLRSDAWRSEVRRHCRMAQGYLVDAAAVTSGAARSSVRIRIAGDAGWINIKSSTLGIERQEFEYAIPLADAQTMLTTLCGGLVEKTRHWVSVGTHQFEVDEFLGDNSGLLVAELELSHADEVFPRPEWLGAEVSHLPRYYNLNLVEYPYANWTASERQGVC